MIEVEHPDVLAWAESETQRTVSALDAHPLRGNFERRIREILDTDDRIPFPIRRGERLFNFWRDAEHPRGLWRASDPESYAAGAPNWQVLVDLDALAAAEDEPWVWKGAHVLSPSYDRALVRLSRGGADASVLREFDLVSGEFVTEDAFVLPEAKSDVSWVDQDTLLVSTDMGEGSLTDSGYPARVYVWRRGVPLSEAELFFAGERSDVAVGAWSDNTPGWERIVVQRALDFYRSEVFVATGAQGLSKVDVPEDAEVWLHREWLFVAPRREFQGIAAGGLGVVKFAEFMAGSARLRPLVTPSASCSLGKLRFTKDFVVVSLLDTVASRLLRFRLGCWEEESLPVPELASVEVIDSSPLRDNELWLCWSSFTQPTTLVLGDAADPATWQPVRQAPELFDARGVETHQYWATSADGTRIPYFVVGRPSASPVPALVYAYGGFEVPLLPGYSAIRGLWLERGNLYVQANLRGGGEFGPEWHRTVTKTQREKVFEDHRAVLEDLAARGLSTSAQIGIRGGSNGGLLSAVALTRYPEALGAAVSQVPLTDMLRYHTWLAGASWMAEYGDPDDPQERAVLERYSPLHQVVPRAQRPYPPVLITTSTRDDRVHPAHARLFAAALGDAEQPVDYVENIEGGHAGAADNAQTARVESIVAAWLVEHLESVSGGFTE